MRNLQSTIDARDLNSVRTFESIFGHEHRSLHPLASCRSRALADAGSLGRSLPCGEPGATFRMSAATYRHGLCPTDMAQGIAQHRHVFERQFRSTPSFGAGGGNRTLVSSLGSWRSTIELHPRFYPPANRATRNVQTVPSQNRNIPLKIPAFTSARSAFFASTSFLASISCSMALATSTSLSGSKARSFKNLQRFCFHIPKILYHFPHHFKQLQRGLSGAGVLHLNYTRGGLLPGTDLASRVSADIPHRDFFPNPECSAY